MGQYFTRGKTGDPYIFDISGEAPSPFEKAWIDRYIASGGTAQAATPAPEEQQPGLLSTLGSGLMRNVNEIQAGLAEIPQSIFEATGNRNAAQYWEDVAKEQRKQRDEYYSPKGGFTGSEGAYDKLRNVVGAVGQSGVSMAAAIPGAIYGGEAGAALGSFLGPLGTAGGAIVGGIVGAGAAAFPQMLSQNAERQIEQHGHVKDWGKAYAATTIQSAIEGTVDKFTLGILGGIGKVGVSTGKKILAKETVDAIRKGVASGVNKSATIIAQKVGVGGMTTALTGATEEVLQQGLERWQAELPLLDDKAKAEYVESAVMGAILEGTFGAGVGAYGANVKIKRRNALTQLREDHDAKVAAALTARDTNAPLHEAKRQAQAAGPPIPTEPLPTEPTPGQLLLTDRSAATREQTLLNKQENQLPPGLRDTETQGPKPNPPPEADTPEQAAARKELAGLRVRQQVLREMHAEPHRNALARQLIRDEHKKNITRVKEIQSLLKKPESTTSLHPGEQGPVKGQFGTETEYRNAIAKLRPFKSVSIDRIKTEMGVKQPQAEALFAEMLRRNDAFPTGNQNQYLQITVPHGLETREGSNERGQMVPRRSRDYIVKPVRPAGHKPFSVEVNGKKHGTKNFRTRAEAQDYIDSRVAAGKKGQAQVVESNEGLQHGIFELQYENLPAGEQRLVGEKVVNTFHTEAEAKEAIKGYDKAYSPESNKWNERLGPEQIAANAKQDFQQELGSTADALTEIGSNVVGKGRVSVGLVPQITALDKEGKPIPDAIVEGQAGVETRLHMKPTGVQKVIRNVITLAVDLYNPNLTAEQRAKALEDVLNHELIHVIRNLDLLTRQEWNTLAQAATRNIPGKPYTWMDQAQIRNLNATPVEVEEEAIAEMARAYLKDPTSFRNPERGILRKIADFIKKLMRLGDRHGAENLMDTIFNGGISDREIGHGGIGERSEIDTFYSLLKPDNMFIKSQRAIENAYIPPTDRHGENEDFGMQWWKVVKNAGINQDEMNWLGIKDWLTGPVARTMLKKQDVLDFIQASGSITHRVLTQGVNHYLRADPSNQFIQSGAGQTDTPRWGHYTFTNLPPYDDAKNGYAEALFYFQVKPGEPTFRNERHYEDANLVANVRFRTIVDPTDGKKYLFIFEVQSDVHNAASKAGGYYSSNINDILDKLEEDFRDAESNKWSIYNEVIKLRQQAANTNAELTKLEKRIRGMTPSHALDLARDRRGDLRRELEDLDQRVQDFDLGKTGPIFTRWDAAAKAANQAHAAWDERKKSKLIPHAPLETNWEEYVMKRMLRHAAEHGFDGIAIHGELASLAETEKWTSEVTERDGPKGKQFFRFAGMIDPITGQSEEKNVTSVVNRYLFKIPAMLNAVGKPFGVEVEDWSASADINLDDTPVTHKPYESYGLPLRDFTPEGISDYFTQGSLKRLYNKLLAKNQTAEPASMNQMVREQRQLGLLDRVFEAHQANARGATAFDALRKANLLGDFVVDPTTGAHVYPARGLKNALVWTREGGTWADIEEMDSANVQARRRAAETRPAFPYKHVRMDINDAMKESLKKGEFSVFGDRNSMLAVRKQEIMADPKFQQWFKGSVVATDNDEPKIVYHGTRKDQPFGRFNRMSHFGTRDAAEERLLQGDFGTLLGKGFPTLSKDERREIYLESYAEPKGENIYPVFLNLRRPLVIQDTGANRPPDLADAAQQAGGLTENEAQRITDEWRDGRASSNALGMLIDTLEKKGYDGFQYVNQFEDKGSTSYAIFRPQQVKSIYNKGQWSQFNPDYMYSKLEARGADLLENDDKFKHWFNGSRVVNEKGEPVLLFHGTGANFEAFDQRFLGKATGHATAQLGFYFTTKPHTANDFVYQLVEGTWPPEVSYPERANIIPAFLSIKNPYRMTNREFTGLVAKATDFSDVSAQIEANRVTVQALRRRLMENGHDGIHIAGNPQMGGTEYEDDAWVTFHPNQIKSALSEEFSLEDDSFKYSMIQPLYSATAPLGQRVPVTPPIDTLTELHARMTYDNLSPAIKRVLGRIIPGDVRKGRYGEYADSTIIALQDRMLSVGRLIDRIKKNGGFISNENDTYLRETLYSSQTDAHLTANERDFYKPIEKTINGLNVTQRDFADARKLSSNSSDILGRYKTNIRYALSELYLYAQHAIERNAVMRKRNAVWKKDARGNIMLDANGDPMPERFDAYHAGSGMEDGEAQMILDWFDSRPFAAEFNSETNPNSVRSRMRALVKNTNDVRVAAELNPDFRTMLKDGLPVDPYKDYVPLRGYLNETLNPDPDNRDFAKTGKGFNIRGKEDMSALGRGSLASDLIAHTMMQNQEAVVRAGKNKVAKSFYNLILDNPSHFQGIAEILQMPATRYGFDRKRGVVRQIHDRSMEDDPSVLKGKDKGQQFYIKLHDPRLAKAFNGKTGLGNTGLNPLLKGLAGINRILAALRTSWNPEFLVSNMFRDLQTAMVNLSEYDQAGLRREVAATVFPALNGVRKALRTGNTTSEWGKVYDEFRRHGGHTAVFGIKELADTIATINSHFQEDFSGPVGKVKRPIKMIGKLIEDYNLAIENGTRLAAYKALRDRYLQMSGDPTNPKNQLRAKEMAAFASKNLTVNFNMGGEAKGTMTAFYMFYNASMQGSMAMLNPFIRNPRMRKLWAGILVAGMVQDMMMSLLSPEDDDGEKTYDKIPEHILEHNIVFMDPFGMSERGYFKFPMPYLMNGIYNWGRSMSKTLRGKYTMGDMLRSGGMTMIDSLNPWGGSNSWANLVAPTIIDPIADLALNEDFTGKPIAPPVSPYDNVGENRSQQYWNNTNPFYVSIADYMSILTGRKGDFIPGYAEFSPNQVEYVIQWLTGGTGPFLARAGQLIYGGAAGLPDEYDVGDVPFLRKGYGQITAKNDLQDYIEGRDQVLRVRKALRDARKEGDNDLYMKLMRDYPDEYKAASRINAIENSRKKLSTKIKRIRDSTRIPEDKKDDMIRALKERQNVLVGRGNEVLATVD